MSIELGGYVLAILASSAVMKLLFIVVSKSHHVV